MKKLELIWIKLLKFKIKIQYKNWRIWEKI